MQKAGTQTVELRIRAGKTEDSGGQAVAFDGETVDSGIAAVILDGQLGARANVIETRVVRWGSRRWNREFSSGTGSSIDETGGSGNGPGCWVVENWDSGRETENTWNRGLGRCPLRSPGSDGGIGDSDGESNLVAEPWLGR